MCFRKSLKVEILWTWKRKTWDMIPCISIGGYITMYFKSTLGFIRILWPTLREDQYLKRDPFLLGSKSCFKKLMIL